MILPWPVHLEPWLNCVYVPHTLPIRLPGGHAGKNIKSGRLKSCDWPHRVEVDRKTLNAHIQSELPCPAVCVQRPANVCALHAHLLAKAEALHCVDGALWIQASIYQTEVFHLQVPQVSIKLFTYLLLHHRTNKLIAWWWHLVIVIANADS